MAVKHSFLHSKCTSRTQLSSALRSVAVHKNCVSLHWLLGNKDVYEVLFTNFSYLSLLVTYPNMGREILIRETI